MTATPLTDRLAEVQPSTAPTKTPAAVVIAPPIECVSWCEDGTGHTNHVPEDQHCSAGYMVIEPVRDEPEQIIPGGEFYRRELTMTLEKDPFSEPFISSWIAGRGGVKLTPAEARQYAMHMLHLADMAEASV